MPTIPIGRGTPSGGGKRRPPVHGAAWRAWLVTNQFGTVQEVYGVNPGPSSVTVRITTTERTGTFTIPADPVGGTRRFTPADIVRQLGRQPRLGEPGLTYGISL
jgi:hypothetical protein